MASPHLRLKRVYIVLIVLTCVLAVANMVYLLFQPDTTLKTLLFCAGQYLGMLVILAAPIILRERFLINVPLALTVAVGCFAFVALVLGDGLDFYGKYSWWDSLLHLFSGIVLGFIGLWVVHVLLADKSMTVFNNRYFLALFLLVFSLALGAIWEICEFSYDELMGTNTQQFMLTTTSSLITDEDIPLAGHEALRDTMTDLILDFLGSLTVALFTLFTHKYLIDPQEISAVVSETVEKEQTDSPAA